MHNMTQEELGQIMGIKKAAVQKYESGSISNIKLDVIKRLCMHFHIPPWIFIFSEEFGERMENDPAISSFLEIKKEYIFLDAVKFYTDYFLLNDFAMEKVETYIHDLLKVEEYKRKFPWD